MLAELMFDHGIEPKFVWRDGARREIVLWSDAAAQLYGIPRAEALGCDPRRLLGTLRADCEEAIATALATEGRWRGELSLRGRAEQTLLVDTRMTRISAPDGGQLVLETGCDITQQRRHEDMVRAAQERLSLALRAGHTGIWEHDLETDAVYWSPETYAVLGVEPFERPVVVEDFARLVHPEDRERLWSQVRRTIETEVPMDVEFRIIRPDGQLRWIKDCGVMSRPQGRAAYLVGTVRDITAERELARAVSASEARYRELANAMPQIVWTCAPNGTADWMNERWSEYTGVGLLAPEALLEIVHPEDRAQVFERWRAGIESRRVIEIEYRLRRHDGQYRWHLGRVMPIVEEADELKCWVAAATDIDDRKRAEESMREAARRKDEFLAVLSHELRNPLAPILTAVQLMKLHGDVPSTREREAIERQAGHLVRLVDDLLDVSRVAQGKIELRKRPLSIAGVVAKAIEITSSLIEQKRHVLTVEVPTQDLVVEADEIRLIQVVTNLLTNAARYTPLGGRVFIGAGCEEDDVVLCVRDNGVGIAAELLPRIFDVFVQGPRGPDRAEGGLGLGLGLVASLTALHGGSVQARSAGLDQGSEFVLRLPRVTQVTVQAAAPTVQEESARISHGAGRKILDRGRQPRRRRAPLAGPEASGTSGRGGP
ncbi:MAG: PAS domain-containing protein [Myxococcales bacterium]